MTKETAAKILNVWLLASPVMALLTYLSPLPYDIQMLNYMLFTSLFYYAAIIKLFSPRIDTIKTNTARETINKGKVIFESYMILFAGPAILSGLLIMYVPMKGPVSAVSQTFFFVATGFFSIMVIFRLILSQVSPKLESQLDQRLKQLAQKEKEKD